MDKDAKVTSEKFDSCTRLIKGKWKCFRWKGSGQQKFNKRRELERLKYTGESGGNEKNNNWRVGRTWAWIYQLNVYRLPKLTVWLNKSILKFFLKRVVMGMFK